MASNAGRSKIWQSILSSKPYRDVTAPLRTRSFSVSPCLVAARRRVTKASSIKEVKDEGKDGERKGRQRKINASRRTLNAEAEGRAESPIAHLPPDRSTWTDEFKRGRWVMQHRFFLSNIETIDKATRLMELDRRSKEAGRKLTILEGYPGAGTMTRKLLFNDNIEKIVAMEDHPTFLPIMQDLSKDPSLAGRTSKLLIKDKECYHWDTYQELMEDGALDHITSISEARKSEAGPPANDLYVDPSWTASSPVLFFSHLPSTVHGEQLISQFVSAIGNRYWQYRYSRMPIILVCSQQLADRCTAQPGDRLRSRMSVVTQALADVKVLMDSSNLLPHHEHFWPDTPVVGRRLPLTPGGLGPGKLSTGQTKEDNCVLLIEPKLQPMISGVEFEAYEYLIRGLFVMRASTVTKALTHMLPGLVSILDAMKRGHPAMASIGHVEIDPNEIVYNLTITQLVALAKMFERWPFRPQHLFSEGRLEELRLLT